MDGRRVVLRQVIGIKPGAIEALDLQQTLAIDAVKGKARNGFDVVENSKL
jgi:hypothetical protein